jgi:hypothetical protein
METINLKKDNVLAAYKGADKKEKALLEKLFGEELKPKLITDRVKTFEDACAIVQPSDNVKTLLAYNGVDKTMLGAVALAKLSIIREALNEGWTPDWSNSNEYKYYPWFTFKAGVGFSHSGYVSVFSRSAIGSRLCFKSSKLAMYAGTQFESIYNDFLTIQ